MYHIIMYIITLCGLVDVVHLLGSIIGDYGFNDQPPSIAMELKWMVHEPIKRY